MSTTEFKRIADAAEPVTSFSDADRVLIITEDGIRQTTREAVLGPLGGAEISDWDARASRVSAGAMPLAFKRTHLLPGTPATTVSIPTIDSAAKTVTKAAVGSGGMARAYWTLTGSIPDTGQYWVAFDAQVSDASTTQRIYIGQQVIDDLVGTVTGDCVGMIELTGTQIKAKRFSDNTESTTAITASVQKVLVQISPSGITVYATGGFIFSFGARPTDDLMIGGVIISNAAVSQYLHVNNNDTATAPRTPDAGYVSLDMLDSVLPTDVYPTDILYTRTASVFRNHFLLAGRFYMLAADDDTIALLDEHQVATLANENHFQKAVGFSTDYRLHGMQDIYDDYVLYAGPATGNLYAAMFTNDGIEASAVYGASFMQITGAPGDNSNLFAFGQCFNSLNSDAGRLVGIGYVGNNMTQPSYRGVIIGSLSANSLDGANSVVFIGTQAVEGVTGFVRDSVYIGDNVCVNKGIGYTPATDIVGNTVIGAGAFCNGGWEHANYNTVMGNGALNGGSNFALYASSNVAVGYQAMAAYTAICQSNVALGVSALYGLGAGSNNIGIGSGAGSGIAGYSNIAIGQNAMINSTGALNQCTAVGRETMTGLGATTNSSAFGYQATVTGDNQVQLGNSATTTYAYGAVQSRSDARDKEAVRNTELGLDFVLALRPVDYQWDYREDYIDRSSMPIEPAPLGPEPKMDNTIAKDDPQYDGAFNDYLRAHADWVAQRDNRVELMAAYRRAKADWLAKNTLATVKKDGSKRRSRFHHGFIAQEVKATADKLGVDFGGFQDHSINGGEDVNSLGYEEFISPIVRAVQELNGKIDNAEFIGKVADKVLEHIASDANNPLIDLIAERMLEKLAAARRSS